jgi:hypothetical protein
MNEVPENLSPEAQTEVKSVSDFYDAEGRDEETLALEPMPQRGKLDVELVLKDEAKEIYKEEPRATRAFELFLQMGRVRTLDKLAHELIKPEYSEWTQSYQYVLRTLKTYSSKYGWQERLRKRIASASAKILVDAQREANNNTRERIKFAQKLYKAGMKIIDKAQLDNLSVDEARRLLKPGTTLVKIGLEEERAEIGDAMAIIRPSKPTREMTNEELEEYMTAIEQAIA